MTVYDIGTLILSPSYVLKYNTLCFGDIFGPCLQACCFHGHHVMTVVLIEASLKVGTKPVPPKCSLLQFNIYSGKKSVSSNETVWLKTLQVGPVVYQMASCKLHCILKMYNNGMYIT
jgi:hypothetical protein